MDSWLTKRRSAALPARETPLSRRYLRVLNAWVPTGREYFSDWPVRPNAGHFLGGCHWYGLETVAGSVAFALLASSGEYDPRLGGSSREDLASMALKGLRYLCFTHDTGPADCVRPAQGLGRPENCGTKWGERGKGFFRESQCGSVVAGMAVTALLLGDRVDAETWAMLEAVHRDYAERFGSMEPRNGVYLDTQMEENAWTSFGLASVECVLEKAPQAAAWAANARLWMFRTATAPQDAENRMPFDGGKTVAELAGTTVTTLPDFMAENHRIVHPSYTACALAFTGHLAPLYGIFGRPLPPHALHNRGPIYERIKGITDGAGYLHPVQGMDWPYHAPDPGALTHAAAAVLLCDPDAAALELRCLRTLESRQEGNGGRMYSRAIGEKCHDIQDPLIIRESSISGPAWACLFHRLLGDGPAPTPEAALERKLRGVRVFPHSGFLLHRHPHGQTSLSWRNGAMALPLTRDGIVTVGPASGSLLANLRVKDRPDSRELLRLDVEEGTDRFAAAVSFLRAQGSVRQDVLCAGLPDGTFLLLETLRAGEDLTVERVEQGFLRIVNETFGVKDDNARGARLLHRPGGSEEFRGTVDTDPESDVVREFLHPAWLNIDGRLGLVFHGDGKTVYRNRHFFETWWATADDLVCSLIEEPRAVRRGKRIARFDALVAPEKGPVETSRLAVLPLEAKDAAGLLSQGWLAAANFSAKQRTVSFAAPRAALPRIPVFPGAADVTERSVRWSASMAPGGASLREALFQADVRGTLRIVSSDTGEAMAENRGRTSASVKVGTGKARTVRPGGILRLS